ncbi:MAG: hypothetical protein WA213_20830 [Terriglobales bacterium]
MFSKRLATDQLQMLSEHSAKSEAGLWIPEYHSLSQIESFNAHFKTLAEKAERDGNDVEAGRVSTDSPIHFDHNRPMVFER